MNDALGHFHFDREPFPAFGPPNYVFENKAQNRIIDGISTQARAESGLWLVAGPEGSGKTFVMQSIAERTSNNDLSIFIPAGERTDILRRISEHLAGGRRRMDADEAFQALEKIHRRGQNIILAIDDADQLPGAQTASLASLMSAMPFLRVVMSGGRSLKKIPKDKKHPVFGERLAGKYRLPHLSLFSGARYIYDVSGQALSLSEYKRAVGFPSAFLLSLAANRNMKNMNYIATAAIIDAHAERRPRVGLRNAMRAIRANLPIVRENMAQKFQKIFACLLALSSLYFVAKIISERDLLIRKIEVRKSIEEQERIFHEEAEE